MTVGLAAAIAAIAADDGGQQFADTQVVAVVLVIEDVSTSQGGLGQVIGKLLFL